MKRQVVDYGKIMIGVWSVGVGMTKGKNLVRINGTHASFCEGRLIVKYVIRTINGSFPSVVIEGD